MKKHLLFLKKATVMLAAMALAALTACENGIQTITKIELSANTESITVGGTATVTATITPATSTDAITWKSSDPEKATIDAQGTTCIVKGVSAGKVTIIASSGNVSDSIEITVSSASSGENNSDNSSGGSNQGTGIYANFYNYPTGRTDPNGTLTLKNQVNTPVLVFTDSVAPQNYIGQIPASSTIKVKLESDKFYNIVAVQKSVYDEKQAQASQVTQLAYYSDTQAYTVSVSPSNLTGRGTWIFNNRTKYWVSIESANQSGETFAVIAPNAQRVSIPMDESKSYDYKVVFKQELKYKNVTMALVDKWFSYMNDTASFTSENNYQCTTWLRLPNEQTEIYSNLLPSVQFTNNTGKSIRVYNGSIQLSNFGAISSEDYVLISGQTAFFTGFAESSNASAIGFSSVAWDGLKTCTDSTKFQKGMVYQITVTNSGSDANPNFTWTVTEKDAGSVYDVYDID